MFPIASNSDDDKLYVDDVFSTYLYTGNSSTQTITNGIDLAGKGGLVWQRSRTSAQDNHLWDTLRGNYDLVSNSTAAQYNRGGTNGVTAFNSNGFTISGNQGDFNASTDNYASWTFRKAPKFFDVVTYTGTGSVRTIAHSLGVAPGMIIVKRTDALGAWNVYHQDLTYAKGTGAYLTTIPGENFLELNNTTLVNNNIGWWNNTDATSSNFTVGTVASVNASGGTYVAYIFASDAGGFGASGTESIIKCGYYVGDGTTNYSKTINTGFEPQFVLVKKTSQTSDVTGWGIADTMRGLNTGNTNWLLANSSAAESILGGEAIRLNSTGFSVGTSVWNSNGTGYIYMAIRRPNKPPTTGTQVYATATSLLTNPEYISNFPVDMSISTNVNGGNRGTSTRLTQGTYLFTNTTAASSAGAHYDYAYMNGWATNAAHDSAYRSWMFKRAPGFFDVVCYTGTGASSQAIAHNLGTSPELLIMKPRNAAGNSWAVDFDFTSTAHSEMYMDLTNSVATYSYPFNLASRPTATQFSVNNNGYANNSGRTFVAYLFATLAGISKVGSYTGNGTSQNIECGFAAGARFVLVKATSTTGDWLVADTARGIVSGNDPRLSLNSTAAEVTGEDWLDPYAPGFTVNQTTASANASGVSYIFLAIS